MPDQVLEVLKNINMESKFRRYKKRKRFTQINLC